MIAPFSKVLLWSDATVAILAILIGFFFGYILESSGFGSSKKLAGVWYGYDFAVIRVMFTAIIVSMLGLFGLYYLGFVNIELVYINPTYLWPQIAGGVIFGMGFNIGQFCPGTSAVACATGKIDGLVFLLGFMVGIFIYSLGFPLIESFTTTGSMGRFLLSDLFALPVGVVVFAVVLIAMGAFYLTHILDKKLGNDKGQIENK